MGLKISKTQQSGLVTEYWKIIYEMIDHVANRSLFKVAPYVSKSFRDYNGMGSFDSSNCIDFIFGGVGFPSTRADCYSKIKTLTPDPSTGDIDWTQAIDE